MPKTYADEARAERTDTRAPRTPPANPATKVWKGIAAAFSTHKALEGQLRSAHAAFDRMIARDQSCAGWARTQKLKMRLAIKRRTGL